MARATRTDVAQRAGVAPSTVSLVLNGRGPELKIAEETIARVEAAARELSYIPRASARALRMRNSRVIGLVMAPLPEHPYVPVVQIVIVAALTAAERRGYTLLPITDASSRTDGEPGEAVDTIERLRSILGQVDLAGVIVQASVAHPDLAGFLERVDVPVVWMSPVEDVPVPPGVAGVQVLESAGIADLLSTSSVRADDVVALVTGPGAVPRRLQTVRDRFPGSTRLVRADGWNVLSARRAAREVLAAPDRPTLMWCASDLLATGVMLTAQDLGLRVGVDLAIIGFGDQETDPGRSEELTSVHWPLRRMSERAVDMLIDWIDAPDGPGGPPERIEIATTATWGTTHRPFA